jgi:ribosome-binding protein aMBF1 (putative translation factor)
MGTPPPDTNRSDQENTMTKRTAPIIPEPNHTLDNYNDANETVRADRTRIQANQRAAAAARAIGDLAGELAERRVTTLAALRKARELTQVQLAETLGMRQGDISKLEQRHNLMLQTLARYIEATGGRLRVVAEYGNDRVELELADLPR